MRCRQMYYQVYYRVKNKVIKTLLQRAVPINKNFIVWKKQISYQNSFNKDKRSFTFLNLEKSFETIDWNYASFGKLWAYNLNYFDFLNQKEISVESGLSLIIDYLKNSDSLKVGLEPYPISLRGINWIKFLSKNSISNQEIDQILYNHFNRLSRNLEYHLLGNHLLENAYALFFGSYYFKDEKMYIKSAQLLRTQLNEQVLKDGAHFELSPMYHQIILERLLDCIQLAKLNPWMDDDILCFLKGKAVKMLGWLQAVTYKNGSIPMVNDSAYGIAPSSSALFEYAGAIGLAWENTSLKDSGYRKYNGLHYECFLDVANIGPDYIPSHAHADTFNFELYINKQPCIVDVGTSTYEKNDRRQLERSTRSHNTVVVNNKNQSNVWGGFRVAKRAKIIKLIEKENEITAQHDGYRSFGIMHSRTFKFKDYLIEIKDFMNSERENNIESFLHFHPNCSIRLNNEKNKILIEPNIIIELINYHEVSIEEYDYAYGFNNKIKGYKLRSRIQNESKIIIKFD